MISETILGPPGTGKTQTNSNRVRDCIDEGIDPDRIACVSFTRKAAKESRDRVGKDWNIDEGDRGLSLVPRTLMSKQTLILWDLPRAIAT